MNDLRKTNWIWPEPRKPSDDQKDKRPWERFVPAVALAVGIPAALVALTILVGKLQSDESKVNLRVEQVEVSNPPEDSHSAPLGREQTAESLPTVDVTVVNRGSAIALSTRAKVHVDDFLDLRYCGTAGGGDVPVSHSYSIELPVRPRPNERNLEAVMHQDIKPDDRSRFVVSFNRARGSLELNFYKLDISLQATNGPVEVGRFLVAPPGAPVVVAGYLPVEDLDRLSTGVHWDASMWCMQSNLDRAKAFFDEDHRGSDELQALTSVVASLDWTRPVSADSDRAIKQSFGDFRDPQLAVYIAEKTMDSVAAERVRDRAIAVLVKSAQSLQKDSDNGLAEVEAKKALELGPSPEAEKVLEAAQRANVLAAQKDH